VPEIVKGDPLRLRQVLQNILGNAVKFTEFGTVDVDVTVTRQTEKRVEFLTEVTDTGVGISPLRFKSRFPKSSPQNRSLRSSRYSFGFSVCHPRRFREVSASRADGRNSVECGE
jgi:light-regulated signal transduction histidine kinase (bacteriophytochrome)